MAEQDRVEPRETCPRCGSAAVKRLRVIEHKSCGAMKSESAFLDGETVTCPDCQSACADVEYVARGSPSMCVACDHKFSGTRGTGSTDDDDVQMGTADVLEGVREQVAAATPSVRRLPWARRVLLVVVILLVVTASGPGAVGRPAVMGQQVTAESSAWNEYRTIVIFRNDDVQPYYRTAEMRAVDRVFIETDVPVTQGVIPAIGGEPLEPHGELCQYLRTRMENHPDTFEYALHGYTHQRRTGFHDGSEFGGIAPVRQRELIRNGTRILDECVRQTPTTFIPPLDTYDNATARALAEANYTVVSGGGWFTKEYYGETGPFEAHGTFHLPNSQSFVKNWTTNEFHDQPYLERQFDSAYRDGDVYVQMLHYPTFTDTSKRAVLRGLIEHMKSKEGVTFMTVGEFARKYRNGQVERTDTGWRVEETTETSTETTTQRAVEIGRHAWERIASHQLVRIPVHA